MRLKLVSLAAAAVVLAGSGATEASASVSGVHDPWLISTAVGNGTYGFSGDGGPATRAQMRTADGTAMDANGNLYVRDSERIRRIDRSGTITTFLEVHQLSQGLAVGGGYLYYTAGYNWPEYPRIYRVPLSGGAPQHFAGNGQVEHSGDGGLAVHAGMNPANFVFDAAGNMLFTDYTNNRIRKIDRSGVITTIAGTGYAGDFGDGGPARNAGIHLPVGLFLHRTGNLYVSGFGGDRVRRIDPFGTITTIAGTGVEGGYGDNGPATQAQLNDPAGLQVDSAGNVFIADSANNRVRAINTSGIITTIAGNGQQGYYGDGGPATNAAMYNPHHLTLDPAGAIYIGGPWMHVVRKIRQ